MENYKYVFAGNRFFVLQKMLEMNMPVVQVFALRDSFLARELQTKGIAFEVLPGKPEMIQALKSLDFDVFVSNGCPVILPISELTRDNTKLFINIHPSLLPDLRGRDPVPGAILRGVPSGATCHIMDDGIDSGNIISQVRIEMTDDLDCGLLYQLSFMAEQEAFVQAFQRGFTPTEVQLSIGQPTHYTRKDADLAIDFSEDAETICRRIRAFDSRSQGAFFVYHEKKFVVRDCEVVTNPFIITRFSDSAENQIVLNYEQKLIIRKGSAFLKLKQISGGDIGCLKPGEIISSWTDRESL
jgi:methionyl-tRNA formyltransferase